MADNEFGRYIKLLRKKRGMNLTEVSSSSGISHPYLSQIENGRRGTPSVKQLKKLAFTLGVDPVVLMVKGGYLEEDELPTDLSDPSFQVDFGPIELTELLNGSEDVMYAGNLLTRAERRKIYMMLKILFN